MQEERQPAPTYYDSSLLQQDDGTFQEDHGASQSEGSNDSEGPSSSKKRKRPMNVTCEACKQRKVKCDRALPACGWCERNQHPCEYKERKKPGLRAGYGRELEGRLDKLESIIYDQGRQLAAHLQQSCSLTERSSISHQPPSNLTGQLPNNGFNISGMSYEPEGITLKQQMIDPQLQRAPTSRQHSLTYSNTGVPPEHAQSVHHYSDASPPSSQLTSPHSTGAMPPPPPTHYAENTAPLPPYDLLYTLVDLYFRHVNVWIPLLDKKSTLDTLFGPSPLTEADKVVLHAVVAVALRFSRDSRLSLENRQLYHNTSKQKVQLYGLENSNIRALQALVILALDVTGSTNGPPGWNLLALISRSVIQLGLSVEATSSLAAPMYPSIATLRASVLPDSRSPIEDEERRRLFWTVYLLDRYATVATAFEFALDDKEVDRRLPCRDDLFSANKSAETKWFRQSVQNRYSANLLDVHGHFAYHCELLGILGHIHLFLKRPIDIGSLADVEQWQGSYRALDGELNAWQFSLPDEFGNITRLMKTNTPAKPVNCGWLMLHAAYAFTTIRLNSSAAYPSQSSPIFSSSYSAMQRCLSAVDDMRQLCQFVKMSGLLDKVGPPFAFSAWVCARVALVHGSIMDHQIDPDIDFFVSMLAEMGQYWDVARRYSEILSRVLGEYKVSQHSGPERVTPSTVKILADMRRCAYDLDFLISRQPHASIKSYHPTRANTPAVNELEYLDVFDLFNFPRMATSADNMGHGQAALSQTPSLMNPNPMMAASSLNFSPPNPDSDWLFHGT
ncbi:hypothetical protein LTR24_008070 [Lithohypha guttulata]|uniref:Zn(2)-C6 fungal-type domain-containing protein n=1 Tax=Lithohypha guttulata TaxID=1690604 RepID=A0ABR0K102_9EURO|nr:hypothetical protein LTR24_008070 [Lithohypha guttulata]